jgi:hypothetical protein
LVLAWPTFDAEYSASMTKTGIWSKSVEESTWINIGRREQTDLRATTTNLAFKSHLEFLRLRKIEISVKAPAAISELSIQDRSTSGEVGDGISVVSI